ncbi:uncharacterized protein ASCRUDRAFT_77656 [Ascoidea rubescens DSM 1968]|uniref:Uncharacterized protein n=1 Tax=Ascoidea rubescens DSM 1968 TaxID=1344418 RepID=A0A1D2VAJ4_9ASCO|nr:hypothetical protein ASCRUDRAFT_77656 [Ascoidea rubescens DSM 1968]ODV58641.1 hypothetical protein ASCRUDRAFT_77656 [Ascoidea rubescens DSM 1968]
MWRLNSWRTICLENSVFSFWLKVSFDIFVFNPYSFRNLIPKIVLICIELYYFVLPCINL